MGKNQESKHEFVQSESEGSDENRTEPSKKVSHSKFPSGARATFSEKTDRIRAVGQFIKSITPVIWAIVALVVIIPLVGKFLVGQSNPQPDMTGSIAPPEQVVIEPRPDFSHVEDALAEAIQGAHQTAEDFAASQLEDWHEEMAGRVDSFLDWYFNYFNQKGMEFKVPFIWAYSAALHQFRSESPTGNEAVAEQLTEDFQREFSKRVLVPRNAQIKLENITQDTVEIYLTEIHQNIESVRQSYKIPRGDWDRYLDDIATTVNDTEGNLSSLSLKVLIGGGSYALAKPLIAISVAKLGSKISAKFAGSAFAKLAAKTGGTVAAEFGSSLIDPLAGVGILLWDVWDYKNTLTKDRPILKETLLTYLEDMETALLKNPETGIMSSIYQLENGMINALENDRKFAS